LPSHSALQTHRRRRHRQTIKRFVCDVCGNAYEFANQLASHAETHADTARYVCRACARPFKKLSYLKRHRCKYAVTLEEKLEGQTAGEGTGAGKETGKPEEEANLEAILGQIMQ